MIKLAALYSPNVLITRPPASFLKVTGDQKLRYDLEWPYSTESIISMVKLNVPLTRDGRRRMQASNSFVMSKSSNSQRTSPVW